MLSIHLSLSIRSLSRNDLTPAQFIDYSIFKSLTALPRAMSATLGVPDIIKDKVLATRPSAAGH